MINEFIPFRFSLPAHRCARCHQSAKVLSSLEGTSC
uniref:Uncharacterized protein n=1 Tax=Arundo donax TaxID=35708 RepID=A0A0A9A7G2_ARUDO